MPGVPIAEFTETKKTYGSLIAKKYDVNGIYICEAQVKGIRGNRSQTEVLYTVTFDLSSFPEALPQIFVKDPPDNQIMHANVFHASNCPFLNIPLPYLCPGALAGIWNTLPKDKRNLNVLLGGIHQILNIENFNSPARRP